MNSIDLEKIYRLNTAIEEFVKNSESEQGYMTVDFANGVHDQSKGTVQYRHKMGGNPTGYIEFNSLEELIKSIVIVTQFLKEGKLK